MVAGRESPALLDDIPTGLTYHVQAVLQGAFVLAKAKGDPAYARDTIVHLKRYVIMLFGKEPLP